MFPLSVSDKHINRRRLIVRRTLPLRLWVAAMAGPVYIISRVADPIFAVFIGVSAAALRINREEKEKGRTTQDVIEAARRYVG